MNKTESLLKFPCNFPIKVFGKAGFEFEASVVSTVRKHIPSLTEGAISLKHSQKGNYVALTAVVYVESQGQLDELYRDLVACKEVLIVL